MKIISLGVGIQSSALYYMSSLGEIERCDYAIFADTGGEKTETLEYYMFVLEEWMPLNNGIPLHKADYKNLQKDLLNQSNSSGNRFASIPAFTMNNGQKGMLRRQCTSEYKIAQVTKKYREILGIGNKRFPQTEIFIGITLDEIHRMTIPQEKWKINVYPFCGYKVFPDGKFIRLDTIKMTRNDVLNWYNKHHIIVPEKSSCVFCPFQSDQNWLRLKSISPWDFDMAVKVDKSIRDSSKRGIKSKIYLHDSLRPLDQVDFDENQGTLWGNCTDYCDI